MLTSHKKTADFSAMVRTMRACSSWEPVSPYDDTVRQADAF
ncbi:hypothetical protein [Haloferax sp. DFSO52]